MDHIKIVNLVFNSDKYIIVNIHYKNTDIGKLLLVPILFLFVVWLLTNDSFDNFFYIIHDYWEKSAANVLMNAKKKLKILNFIRTWDRDT